MKEKYFIIFFLVFGIIGSASCMNITDLNMALFESVKIDDSFNLNVNLTRAKELLAEGADPNWICQDSNANTSILFNFVLNLCISKPSHDTIYKDGLKAIELLFSKGAKVQSCDRVILFYPVAKRKYDLVKLLLENGATTHLQPYLELNLSCSLLETALAKNDDAIAKLLLKYGAKPLPEDYMIQLRFFGAVENGSISDIKKLALLGAQINSRNKDDQTPLMLAISRLNSPESYKLIQTLIEMGANVNLPGKGTFYNYPLHEAIWVSSVLFKRNLNEESGKKVIQTLILHGAHVSKRDNNSVTPLHVAARFNNIFAAKELIEAGAKLMDKDSNGKTPLDFAESGDMIKLLKKHGAKE